jgi:putative ubiquitin-RnfH superfamily antitoxin RatB of RatAB toxin-antitoxin module
MPELITVEVAYATPEQQQIIALDVPANTTVETAIRLSGLLTSFPEINLSATAVGIFGKVSELNQVLKTGDRVEIYRPLLHDPKEARRQRAARG